MCLENIQKFGALSRVFDNDRFFSTIFSEFVCSTRSQCNRCEADAAIDADMPFQKKSGKALRVIPRGKHRLTVYRAHQVGVNGSQN